MNEKKKYLNPEPARNLRSREIAKIIVGMLGGFVDWCGAKAVCDVIDHLCENREFYKETFRDFEKYLNETRRKANVVSMPE